MKILQSIPSEDIPTNCTLCILKNIDCFSWMISYNTSCITEEEKYFLEIKKREPISNRS